MSGSGASYDRAAAWATVCEFTASPNLRKHMLAVEAALGAYARKLGADEDLWRTVGLLHDFDYEMHPTLPDHPEKGVALLAERGWPEEIRRAILSHSSAAGVPRVTPLEKHLHACDDVTGFVTAVALVQPDRSLAAVTDASMAKKWKSKAFAAGVDRDEAAAAAADIGVPLTEHLHFVLEAMRSIAGELGLAGEPGRA